MISWIPPPLPDRNGIITEYSINITELDTATDMILTSSVPSLFVIGLHPYYEYVVAVSAQTVALGPYSEPETIQTPEDGKVVYCDCHCLAQVLCFPCNST